MYLMYVDESGDSGVNNSPTRYYILTGIVFHELLWTDVLTSLVDFRRALKASKGLKIKEEIHSVEFINRPGKLVRIPRNDRVDILKKCLSWLDSQQGVSTFSIVVDKQNKSGGIFELAWESLLNRFENTIIHKNFPGPQNADDRGIVISDNTEGEKLTILIRKMRHYNPVPNAGKFYSSGYRNVKLKALIEDPIMKDSKNSLIHQIVDVVAYSVRQRYEPNAYMKKKGGRTMYEKLSNVALKVASANNNWGLVER